MKAHSRRIIVVFVGAALVVLATNAEGLGLVLTLQAIGVDVALLLLVLQARTLVCALAVALSFARAMGTRWLAVVWHAVVLSSRGLFARDAFRAASWQLALSAWLWAWVAMCKVIPAAQE
jgi:hypothetical protein